MKSKNMQHFHKIDITGQTLIWKRFGSILCNSLKVTHR